jgi:acetylornithine/N-succinyldiaminopimelate aminotransferase
MGPTASRRRFADHRRQQGCHGRSLATISASDSSTWYNRSSRSCRVSSGAVQRLPALHAAVDARTVAIMLEPIQSDAGVIPATEHYLKGVERLCRELGILLILDEVQTGIGRCGTARRTVLRRARRYRRARQGLGGGVPLAALLARGKACFDAGELGGTHHGNA